jgi:hypothetical protein
MNQVHMDARPLLRRTQLRPNESLYSLLERLAQLNFYPHARMLDQICRERQDNPALRDALARPQQAQTFLHLAELTRLSPDALFAASDHRFASILPSLKKTPTSMAWPDAAAKPTLASSVAQHHLCSATAARFCPLCVQDDAYHRLNWIPVAAAACLDHQCLLHDCCPQCRAPVPVSAIITGRCRACQADLGSAPVISLAADAVGMLAQQVIQHLLALALAPDLPAESALPGQPAAVCYHLLEGLCRSLRSCRAEWGNLPAPLDGLGQHIPLPFERSSRLTPVQAYHLYRVAFTGIWHWPHGLFRFLDAYVQRNPVARASKTCVRLGMLWHIYFRRAWWHPEFEFAHQALTTYMSDRQFVLPCALIERFRGQSWFVDATGLWTMKHTAQALDISIHDLPRFFPDGPLDDCLWPHSRSTTPLFERDKVLAVARQCSTGWPLAYACAWLGMVEDDVIQLVKHGTLILACGDDQDHTTWVLTRQSVETFFEKVMCRLELIQKRAQVLMSLSSTALLLSGSGIDRVALLQAVADGILPAYKLKPTLRSLCHVHFLYDMLFDLPDLLYAQHG